MCHTGNIYKTLGRAFGRWPHLEILEKDASAKIIPWGTWNQYTEIEKSAYKFGTQILRSISWEIKQCEIDKCFYLVLVCCNTELFFWSALWAIVSLYVFIFFNIVFSCSFIQYWRKLRFCIHSYFERILNLKHILKHTKWIHRPLA